MSEKTFAINVDMGSVDRLVASLQTDVSEAVRPMAQAGAQVLYNDVKKNVGSMGKVTGNLDRAIYQVYSRKDSTEKRAAYYVSWNYTKAPHGHLLEYGHWQYFATYIDKNGRWKTAIRPEMVGKPKPKRRASLAEKMAYYVPRKGGPVYIKGRAFVRQAQNKFPQAVVAMETELIRYMNEGPLRTAG